MAVCVEKQSCDLCNSLGCVRCHSFTMQVRQPYIVSQTTGGGCLLSRAQSGLFWASLLGVLAVWACCWGLWLCVAAECARLTSMGAFPTAAAALLTPKGADYAAERAMH